MAIGRVQLEKLPGALQARRNFVALVASAEPERRGHDQASQPSGDDQAPIEQSERLLIGQRRAHGGRGFAGALAPAR